MTAPKADVTILGAGIIGVCCALEALDKGLSVQVIDRLPPGEATSHGNAGVISPWSVVPQCTPGVWKNVPRWLMDPTGPVKVRWRDLPGILPWVWQFLRNAKPDRVAEISDAMALLMDGNVDAYQRHLKGTGHEGLMIEAMNITVYRDPTKPSPEELQFRLRVDRGCDVEFIGRGDLGDLEPDLAKSYTAAALIKNQARTLNPGLLCKALAEKAGSMGAKFLLADIKALEPTPSGPIKVHTDSGHVDANRLVLAGGIWSAELLRPLGIHVPLIAERGYHLEFENPEVTINNSINDAGAKVIASLMNGGVRIAGTAEFAAVDAPPNYARADALAPLAKRLFPKLNTSQPKKWMGIRPSFPDNLPAIGAVPGIDNLFAAFGHSHYGLGMGPGTARLVIEAMRGATNQKLENLNLGRFAR